MSGTWERVRAHGESGRTIYWRFIRDGKQVGAVTRFPGGWRALLYGDTILSNRELGMHRTWQAARRRVEGARPNSD